MNNLPTEFSMIAKGWQCPVCSAVMAPAMMWCIHCKPKPQVDYTSTLTNTHNGCLHEGCYIVGGHIHAVGVR